GPKVRFEVAAADQLSGGPYDLVTMFDCLHDMGDPIGAARQVRGVIAEDGSWMIVEPAAGDRVEDNFNPVGRAYYGFSTLLCTPSS
ncbi:SAM-dependent methyltransferase, partial [Mycobacterium sp. ITM-2017-0098]